MPVPFVIYADFEAITEKDQSCSPEDSSSYTEAYQKYTDCGCAYKLVCCYDDKDSKDFQTFRDENTVYRFQEQMFDESKYCIDTAINILTSLWN